MKVTRRNLLKVGAGAGAGLLLPLHLPTAANAMTVTGITPFTEQLPTLNDLGIIDATTGVGASINMVNATHSFHKNMHPTPTLAYRSMAAGVAGPQNYLGPVIVAKRDVPFQLTVSNDLTSHPMAAALDYGIMGTVPTDATAPRACVHLHGGNTDPANDGDPLDFFPNTDTTHLQGTTRTYTWENSQEAAGLWYHDHALGITRLNVLAGLASGYLVRDTNDPGNGTLLPAPPYEVPLILQDRSFNTDGTFSYPSNTNPGTPRPWVPEFFGNVATVNGKVAPNLNVNKGKYRFRVYNGSQARFYNLKLMYGGTALPFFQIGTDGGLLDAPVSLSTLLLATGERADLVVDFAALPTGAKIIVTNDAVTPYPAGGATRFDGGSPLPQIMQFTVTSTTGWTTALPTNLRSTTAPITRLAGLPVAYTRYLSLVEVHNEFDSPTMVTMNNQSFMGSPAMQPVASNTLEEWVLINTTVDAHPMHVHFAEFQVISRQPFNATQYSFDAGYANSDGTSTGAGKGTFPPPDVTKYLSGTPTPPHANEMGWKDTILCMPGEVTRIRIPFGPNVVPGSTTGTFLPMAIGKAHTGPYVSHCHILEHEENDMMMRFTIA